MKKVICTPNWYNRPCTFLQGQHWIKLSSELIDNVQYEEQIKLQVALPKPNQRIEKKYTKKYSVSSSFIANS